MINIEKKEEEEEEGKKCVHFRFDSLGFPLVILHI